MEEEGKTSESGAKNSEEIPDVRAFNDEFTRSFLKTKEETRPGYYLFVSGTDAYKMDFPRCGVIGERGYAKKDDSYEGYLIGVAEKGFESSIKINYYSSNKEGNENIDLEMLNSQFNNLTFEKISLQDRNLFLASFEESDGIYGYVGYIQNEIKNGGIQIIYETECMIPNKCTETKNEQREKIIKWFKSIKFIQKESN
ncbi:hypothetical protein [Virgibacillus necropolis]|uniref:Uncharacterized protein n=1 Tax=Virgibacillus necropolis TaxID=163877 RepID=A0A221MEM5_9BACI|nr:hypothetical protein [Virgibacillus necropolis]ASN06091.1 hypothetical protein CFK40_14225 [Virgibacillus necropolis]